MSNYTDPTIASPYGITNGSDGNVWFTNYSGASVSQITTGAGATFHPVAPSRVVDSRPQSQVGPFSTPWGAGTTRDIVVGGHAGVPLSANAVVLNVTVTNTTAPSFLTIWPTGQAKPLVSSLNWAAGKTVANAVTVKLGIYGKLAVFNPGGNADVIVDVAGYYDFNAGDGFVPLAPTRIQDSRPNGPKVGHWSTPWGPGVTRLVNVAAGGVPDDADAVVLNVTVTNTTAPSFLSVWPSGLPKPLVSSLNWVPGQTVPNAVTTKLGILGNAGKLSVYNPGGKVDVIVDVSGWFG